MLILDVDVKQPVSVNEFDRLIAYWIMTFVGNPRIAVRLWDGNEFYFADGMPVGVMEFRDRSAMVDLIFSQRVGFGEGYSKGKIVIHGDILEFLNEVSRAFAKRGDGSFYLDKFRSLLSAIRGNTLGRSRDNVHHHYDLGNDFLRDVARRTHGLYLRLLRASRPDAG